MTTLDQLVHFYKQYEGFHKNKLEDNNIRLYFAAMLKEGRLITCEDEGTVLGYCDYARVNYAQFACIILSDIVSPEIDDPEGKIVHVHTVVVAPQFRGVGVVEFLKKELIRRNPEASYIVGRRQGKRYKPIVIFKGRNKVVV